MVSRNFTDTGPVSMHWNNPAGPDVLVEIRRTSTARDVREGLLALAYAVDSAKRPAMGLCVIVDSRLSAARLDAELNRFKTIVRPEVASRMHLVAARTGMAVQLVGNPPEHSREFMQALYAAVQEEAAASGTTRVTRQQLKAVLVERALCGLTPLSLAGLRRQTGASYQTASAALNELQQLGLVIGKRDGPIPLLGLRPLVLRKLADEHAAARKLMRFTDPTGLGRPPSAMADRLLSLRRKGIAGNVAISGVLGATRFYPDLDITAAPRLDLSVYDGDVRFVAKLDAGLVKAEDQKSKPSLVLHLLRDCRPPEIVQKVPELAARLDCLADLEQMGLQAQADGFAHALCETAKRTR